MELYDSIESVKSFLRRRLLPRNSNDISVITPTKALGLNKPDAYAATQCK